MNERKEKGEKGYIVSYIYIYTHTYIVSYIYISVKPYSKEALMVKNIRKGSFFFQKWLTLSLPEQVSVQSYLLSYYHHCIFNGSILCWNHPRRQAPICMPAWKMENKAGRGMSDCVVQEAKSKLFASSTPFVQQLSSNNAKVSCSRHCQGFGGWKVKVQCVACDGEQLCSLQY